MRGSLSQIVVWSIIEVDCEPIARVEGSIASFSHVHVNILHIRGLRSLVAVLPS